MSGLANTKFVLAVNLLKILPNTLRVGESADCNFEKRRGQTQLSENQSTQVPADVSCGLCRAAANCEEEMCLTIALIPIKEKK